MRIRSGSFDTSVVGVGFGSFFASHRNLLGVRSVPIAEAWTALFSVCFGENRRSPGKISPPPQRTKWQLNEGSKTQHHRSRLLAFEFADEITFYPYGLSVLQYIYTQTSLAFDLPIAGIFLMPFARNARLQILD